MKDNIWFQTFTGLPFDLLAPKPEQVCIEDIAHHLALINRFNGATRVPYSVAQHSVWVADYLREMDEPPAVCLLGLLHDAHEAYTGDIIGPMKKILTVRHPSGSLWDLSALESMVDSAILTSLSLTGLLTWRVDVEVRKSIKRADVIALATEKRDLMAKPPKEWAEGALPYGDTIYPLRWKHADELFFNRYTELKGALDGDER